MITPTLEFAFSVRLEFPPGPSLRFPLQAGGSRGLRVAPRGRSYGAEAGRGGLWQGSGGDWPLFRADGVVVSMRAICSGA